MLIFEDGVFIWLSNLICLSLMEALLVYIVPVNKQGIQWVNSIVNVI